MYVRLLLCNFLFLKNIIFYLGILILQLFTKQIYYYFFLNHGQYIPRGPDH